MSQVSAEFIPTRIAILTISNRRGEEDDTSGHFLRDSAQEAGHQIVDKAIVKENRYQIRAQVSAWIARDDVQVVLITGGTGLTDGDQAPEALLPLFDREIEGFGEVFRMLSFEPLIDVQTRYWFNPATISQHFIIPGAITIIMTVIGAILTSLVIAREWERGTMEALLSTEVTRVELLLCKLIPYYFLGMLAMLLCMLVSVFVLGVPYRGSLVILFFITSLFLLSTLGMGLLISTITRNQFNAAQVALNAAFLPSIMLSGFIFQIDSMPAAIRVVTYIIPARYFVSTLQSLFLAGNIPVVLMVNTLFLIASAVMFIGLTWMKTKRRLD